MKKDFVDALELAMYAHKDQFRKGGEDYIIHPIEVAEFLKEKGMPQFVVDAGYLHDTLEDSYITEEDIVSVSSEETLRLVELVTKVKLIDKINAKPDEKLYDIDDYDNNIMQDFFATSVKIADRINNVMSLTNVSEDFKKKYIKETIEKYVELSDKLKHIESFDFASYEISSEGIRRYADIGKKISSEFDEALLFAQAQLPERYCPITKSWVSYDETIYIGRDDGIMISQQGLEQYIENYYEMINEKPICFIKDNIDDYLDFWTEANEEFDDEEMIEA